MVSVGLMGLLIGMGCSPLRRIPAPDPPQSALPPTQARAHYTRGQIWLARGDNERAQAAFDRARVFDPDSPQIHAALSSVAFNRGDMVAARSRLSEAAALGAENPRYWLEYGRLEMAFGDEDVARTALNRALSLGGGWQVRAALIADALRNQRPSTLLNDWAAEEVTNPIELRRRADLRMASGDRIGALQDYVAVLELAGRDLSLVTPIVAAATQGGRLAWTLLAAENQCLEQPGSSASWMIVGLISSVLGDAQAAVDALEQAQELGVVLGPGPQAALDKARMIIDSPSTGSSGPALRLDDPISRIIRLVQQERWEEGEQHIQQGLDRNPEDPRLLYMLGELNLKRDGPEAAKEPIEKILAIQPSYGPALNMWAWIHAEQGLDLENAERHVREALHLQPGMASYWDTLGWILHLRGEHRTGCLALKRALRLSPKDDTVQEHLEACLSQWIGSTP